jgi:alpha-L-fucosidase
MKRQHPSPRQLEYLSWQFGIFLHFGLRTFYEGWKDWDDRPMDPGAFNPSDLDCDQWADVAVRAGAKYMVLTAKHHDGFTNWPSKYTDFGVHSSGWRDGGGDVVAEFVAACRRRDLAVGLYYSPADASSPIYEDPAAYDEYFINQVREILAPYGPIDMIWFDGCGSENHEYDWPRIVGEIRSLQPEILIFNMADPDFRWIGNESGIAPYSHSNLTTKVDVSVRTDRSDSLDAGGSSWFLPAECDLMIRDENWFFQEYDADTVKSADELVGLYYYSVGRGANMLLNIGPDRRGHLPEADATSVVAMRSELDRRFASPIATIADFADGDPLAWTYEAAEPFYLDHIVLGEDLSAGESVIRFSVELHSLVHGRGVILYEGTTIGRTRIIPVPRVRGRGLTVRVTPREGSARADLSAISVYDTSRRQRGV